MIGSLELRWRDRMILRSALGLLWVIVRTQRLLERAATTSAARAARR